MAMNGGSERFEMMVPGHKVGMIIGKGGENIRNMQESTGAKIVIVQVRCRLNFIIFTLMLAPKLAS